MTNKKNKIDIKRTEEKNKWASSLEGIWKIERWFNESYQGISLILDRKGEHISLSLSLKEFSLLKKAIEEFK